MGTLIARNIDDWTTLHSRKTISIVKTVTRNKPGWRLAMRPMAVHKEIAMEAIQYSLLGSKIRPKDSSHVVAQILQFYVPWFLKWHALSKVAGFSGFSTVTLFEIVIEKCCVFYFLSLCRIGFFFTYNTTSTYVISISNCMETRCTNSCNWHQLGPCRTKH